MKVVVLTLIAFFLSANTESYHKMGMLCGTWKLVGIKNIGKEYKVVDPAMSEIITIKADGTFEEQLYGAMQIKGEWKFSDDSSKLAFGVTEMDGNTGPGLDEDSRPTDSIIKLTDDTLIYGSLKYNGSQTSYGHDDMYFVKEK